MTPRSRARSTRPGGAGPPPSSTTRNRSSGTPASSRRRSWVGTSETSEQSSVARATASTSKPSCTVTGTPLVAPRSTIASPATEWRGTHASHRSRRRLRVERLVHRPAGGKDRGTPVDDQSRVSRGPRGRDHEGRTGGERCPTERGSPSRAPGRGIARVEHHERSTRPPVLSDRHGRPAGVRPVDGGDAGAVDGT